MSERHCQVLIAGAGLAGLSAAAYLSRAGYSVLLVEKNENCGGLLNSFRRDGFVFDAGARSIENAGVIRPMLHDLGIELELLESPVSIGIESKILGMDSKNGIEEYRKHLESLYPGNMADIRRIIRAIHGVMREMRVIYGFDNPVFKNFRTDTKYIVKELLPWLGRFLLAVYRMNRMDEPIERYLERLTTNRSLADIVDQHFFKNTPSFFALGYFFVYLDYLYPKGGTGKLSEKLSRKVLESGGEILLKTEITSVSPSKNTATDGNGTIYRYDKLIWCADLKALYRNLELDGLGDEATRRIEAESSRVFAGHGGDSVFTVYMGVDRPPADFAATTNGHLFYTPSREGLGETHRSELGQLLSAGKTVSKERVRTWVEKYCALTTYEISIPSLRDPSLSPEGKTGLIVSFLLSYDLVRSVFDAGWYEEFKTLVEDCIVRVLDQAPFPGLKDRLSLRFSSSPLSIERVYGNSEGGITGWTFEQPSPAVHDLLKIPESVLTPMKDILQAGQWAYSPAGIPTAILTGWYAADAIKASRGKS